MTLPGHEFPRLTPDNHGETSPATPNYIRAMIDTEGSGGYIIQDTVQIAARWWR